MNKLDLTKYGKAEQEIQLIKDHICVGASDADLALFLAQCQRTKLDPFLKQIYSIGRYNKQIGRKVFTTQISIDGARLVAQRSRSYAGQIGPHWCGSEGTWVDVWLKHEPPMAARVGVCRENFKEPLFAVANWSSYVQDNPMWRQFPALMLAKVAEMLALRRAFPMELNHIYVEEEISSETIPAIEATKSDSDEVEVEMLTRSPENLSRFFAACEALGIPNTDANKEFLRKCWSACEGKPLHELVDIVQEKINSLGSPKVS